MTRPRLLFYVQHLLGIGHLVRASRIAKALAGEMFELVVVVGGDLPPRLDFGAARVDSLPPVKAGPAGFAELVTAEGAVFGPEQRAARRDRLLALFGDFEPDVLLIEAFPFGRRQMRFELLPLLEAARARTRPPLVAASVRDILQENRKAGRDAETVAQVQEFFDLVIVHGDPALAELGDSFPLADAIADRIVYSGLVGPDMEQVFSDEHFDVIVSVGGGAVGAALIRLAIAARPFSKLADASWLVLTGPNAPADLEAIAHSGLTLRRFEPDLPARLRRARISISQAGYNTVADLLSAPACRAVLVPHAAGGETEQTRRAALLEARGWAVAVAEATLDAGILAAAIDRCLDMPPASQALDFRGARRTGKILAEALNRRRPDRM